MASTDTTEVYDLLFLVDATYSMYNFLESLKSSLPKIIAISNLTNAFSRIGLLAYRDYSEADRDKEGLLEWSGWYSNDEQDGTSMTAAQLMATAASLTPIGGGDYPEATKTGLARAYSLMREDATTIILLYTDAPPHCWMVADKDRFGNYHREQAALKITNSYHGFGPKFTDWVSASKFLHEGPRKARIFSFLDDGLAIRPSSGGYYTYLSTITRGICLSLTDTKPQSIAQVTVDVLLAWMGTEKAGASDSTLSAKLMRYQNGENIKKIKDEKDERANIYFWAHAKDFKEWQRYERQQEEKKTEDALRANIAEKVVDTDVLRKHIVKRKTPVQDFSQRYTSDAAYRVLVVKQLKDIIETDVTSISLNPVFGALWRTVCNDRENPARDELITAFGLNVERITNADEKARMKNWLEESYDYAAEILAILNTIEPAQRFPCVYLDPTIEFSKAKTKGEKEDEEEDTENRPIQAFRRDELLEIGRSCDGRILRRLGKVLTQLSYAQSEAELPSHIAATTDAEVPKIPLSLASKERSWEFFKMLLHVVLPGTMLASRPATVLAALAIRIGLQPLFEAASETMLFWRDRWNNLEVPETWNSSCLGLLLDADSEYRKQKQLSGESEDGLLKTSDRKLFTRLVMYQHTGSNLLTTLTAEVGWTPDKTRLSVGPLVVCRQCNFPRSVTIMAERGGICGLCAVTDWADEKSKNESIQNAVTKDDTESSLAAWVECSMRTCRAQYVCYNTHQLNVRPKCHYCRAQPSLPEKERSDDSAPTLECTTCLNKIIWPSMYRAIAKTPFRCFACTEGKKTVELLETSADQICKENGRSWLLRNDSDVLKEPFKRSLFHTVSTVGPDKFEQQIEVFPSSTSQTNLTLRGKLIQNRSAVIDQLKSWVTRRTAEKSHCSLCFSSFSKSRLMPACRRNGCNQQICSGCLEGWYGLNHAGSLINTAALSCPFCRRAPAARTLAAYGMGIHAVGDLRIAVEESGQWIHAWCYDCGKAKRYMERECARGAPDAVEQWRCEECAFAAQEAARVAEEEAQQVLALLERMEEEDRAAARNEYEKAQRSRIALEIPVKECPGCQTPTQKTGGCNHMTCPIRSCGKHWCWVCGEKFGVLQIYQHMNRSHGGFYGGGGADESDFEDDYD